MRSAHREKKPQEPGRGRAETTVDIPEFLELQRLALAPYLPIVPIHFVLASSSFTCISVALPICASLRSLVDMGGDMECWQEQIGSGDDNPGVERWVATV